MGHFGHAPTDAEDAAEVLEMLEEGYLKPAPKELTDVVQAIKEELLAPLGLKPPDVPLYIANGRMMPFMVTATTKFDHDKPDSEKRAKLIALNAIFLPLESELDTAATLAHELIHASLPYNADAVTGPHAGHGPVFKSYADRIGLVGDPRSTDPGPQFKEWFKHYKSREE